MTNASVEAVTLAILDAWQVNFLSRWIAAVTLEQARWLHGLPWVISPKLRGPMVRHGDQFEFLDPESRDVWRVSTDALDT